MSAGAFLIKYMDLHSWQTEQPEQTRSDYRACGWPAMEQSGHMLGIAPCSTQFARSHTFSIHRWLQDGRGSGPKVGGGGSAIGM